MVLLLNRITVVLRPTSISCPAKYITRLFPKNGLAFYYSGVEEYIDYAKEDPRSLIISRKINNMIGSTTDFGVLVLVIKWNDIKKAH